MANIQIDTNAIIDQAVREALQSLNTSSIQIKQQYYSQIVKELNEVSLYFRKINRVQNLRKSSKLTNPYAPEYGFDTAAEYAYEITVAKKNSAVIYNKINKILSFLRQGQEITYALYIKDTNNKIHRYEVPESQINDFTNIVQSTSFKMDQDLRDFANTAIERLENGYIFQKHMDEFMKAVDDALSGTSLSLKLADKYEAFEYHYQMFDRVGGEENFAHSFNVEQIRKWLLTRGHDTVGWWVRGDIGLTSVKSVNLNNKFLFLNLATEKSLQEIYQLLQEIFNSSILGIEQLSRLVKAFTPLVHDLKMGIQTDVQKTVNDLIESLIK